MTMTRRTWVFRLFLALSLAGYACLAYPAPVGIVAPDTIESPALRYESRIEFHSLYAAEENRVWAAGSYQNIDGRPEKGIVLCSDDLGLSWKEKLAVPGAFFKDIFFINAKVGWAVGSGPTTLSGVIFKTTDSGETWAEQTSPRQSASLQVRFINQRKGWILGYLGDLLYTNDGGATWGRYRLQQPGFNNQSSYPLLKTVNFSDEMNGWIVGEQGQLYQSTDGGESWQNQFPKLRKIFKDPEELIIDFHDVKFFTPQLGFLVAEVSEKKSPSDVVKMLYVKTVDGGNRWEIVSTIEHSWLPQSLILNQREAWVQVQSHQLLHTVDAGKTWEKVLLPKERYVPSRPLLCLPAGNILLLSDSSPFTSLSLFSKDGGKTWEKRKLIYMAKYSGN